MTQPMPVDAGDVCQFCSTYTPPQTPAQQLDIAINKVDLLRADINAMVSDLPDSAPLFAVVDLVNALRNLRNASTLLDRAATALEATTAEVPR